MDGNGSPLTSGPEGNQNGALVELGYFLDQNQDFVKTSNFAEVDTWKWVPLTTRTVGDSSSGYGFEDGMFAFTTTFTQDSEQIINYYTEPRQLHRNFRRTCDNLKSRERDSIIYSIL